MPMVTKLLRDRFEFLKWTICIFLCSLNLIQSSPVEATTSSISSNFNGNSISAGSTIWFTLDIQLTGTLPSNPVTLYLVSGNISFTANSTNYNLAVPNGQITFNPNPTTASTTYSGGQWVTNAQTSGTETLFTALAYTVPAGGLPAGIQNVLFSGNFLSNTSGLTISWEWAAATYSQFGSYNSLGVTPQYSNGVEPGTPTNEESYLTAGALGPGGTNYIGGFSGHTSITPSLAASEPSSFLLLGTAIALIAAFKYRKKSTSSASLKTNDVFTKCPSKNSI